MDTPLTALRWLLASEDRCDEFLTEIEALNTRRQEVVKGFAEKALTEANPDDSILFFIDEKLEHGLIGLVAGKLTEAYNRPSIALCESHNPSKAEVKKREYEGEVLASKPPCEGVPYLESSTLIASCRSPEWCNLVELLDECREYFVRYGGHRQAAGFTIEKQKLEDFKKTITAKFIEKYGHADLPTKTIKVESRLSPRDATLETLSEIKRFQPFGIGNPRPLWLLENVTIMECKYLGKDEKHLTFKCAENPNLRMLMWNASDKKSHLEVGNIVSLIVELDQNEWNGKVSVQGVVRELVI